MTEPTFEPERITFDVDWLERAGGSRVLIRGPVTLDARIHFLGETHDLHLRLEDGEVRAIDAVLENAKTRALLNLRTLVTR